MMKLLKARIQFSLFVLTILPVTSLGADNNYQDFLVGGRAIGLGGAFTATANDVTSLLYNPAGLSFVESTSAQLSTSLYGIERGSLEEFSSVLFDDYGNIRVDLSDVTVVPSSAGAVRTLGRTRWGTNHSLAFGLLVPSYRTSSLSSRAPVDEDGQSSSYVRRTTDRELWSAVGYGLEINPKLRVGVAGYYIFRSMVDTEEASISEASIQNGGIGRFALTSSEVTVSSGSLLLGAGAHWQPSPRVRFGLFASLPSTAVHSEGAIRTVRSGAYTRCPTSLPCMEEEQILEPFFEERDVSDLGSGFGIAPMVRLGFAYEKPRWFLLAADVVYYGAIDYALLRDSKAQSVPENFVPFSNTIQRRAIVNFHLGAEYWILPDVTVSGGIFSNRSTAPDVPNNPLADALAQIDMYGLSFSTSYTDGRSTTWIGAMYSYGLGEDVIATNVFDQALESQVRYERIELTRSYIYFFLASSLDL